MSAAVRVHGIRELDRAFRMASRESRREMRREIRGAAGIVAKSARQIALFRGLEDTGDLIRSTRPGTRGPAGVVRVTATRRGYPYPRIYEYGGRGRGETVGPRAFLAPAVELDTPVVVDRMERMLDRIHRGAGL